MKPETILNAMRFAQVQAINYSILHRLDAYNPQGVKMPEKRERQYNAFRARILRMFEEREEYIEQLIDENIQNVTAFSKRIAELEKRIENAKVTAVEAMTRTTCDWEYNTADDIVKALDGEELSDG